LQHYNAERDEKAEKQKKDNNNSFIIEFKKKEQAIRVYVDKNLLNSRPGILM
jgi:hypothetical protein